jgi:protein-disulfide isomerase
MDENQNYGTQQSAPAASGNSNLLPISILVAAILISGSIFYVFGKSGTGTGTTPGQKNWPKTAFTQCFDSHKYAAKVKADLAAAQPSIDSIKGGTPSSFINGIFVNGAQPWATFKKAIDKALSGPANAWPAQAADVDTGVKLANVPNVSSDDVVLGDPNAPVTFIEYGDYQCPFCARFFNDTEPLIRDQYIKTGKVKMIFRNYPFLDGFVSPPGTESEYSAEAAECAKDQGKFWEYHDALYTAESQDGHENNGNLNRDLFFTIADNLKLNAK